MTSAVEAPDSGAPARPGGAGTPCGAKEPCAQVLYVSSFLSARAYAQVLAAAPYPPSQATQKYDALLTAGLVANGAQVTALSAPPVGFQTGGGRVVRLKNEVDAGVEFCYLPVIHLPGIKHIACFLAAFFHTLRRCSRKTQILCYGLVVSASAGARAAAHILGLPVSVIVSDLPEELGGGRLMRIAARELTRYDGYILLTEAMNERVNPHKKPYCVIEGQADAAMRQAGLHAIAKDPEPVCLYAGMLHARYGILRLVRAFMLLDCPQARLVLYGAGDARDEILRLAEQDGRIEYRGVADNATVVDAQRRATLLINPRPSDESFTKYSFPSKNLEYMASGTPVLTTRLPGMPEEYHPYVYLFDGETPEAMADMLARVLALPVEARDRMGRAARDFVLDRKSNVSQARRVLTFLAGLHR